MSHYDITVIIDYILSVLGFFKHNSSHMSSHLAENFTLFYTNFSVITAKLVPFLKFFGYGEKLVIVVVMSSKSRQVILLAAFHTCQVLCQIFAAFRTFLTLAEAQSTGDSNHSDSLSQFACTVFVLAPNFAF